MDKRLTYILDGDEDNISVFLGKIPDDLSACWDVYVCENCGGTDYIYTYKRNTKEEYNIRITKYGDIYYTFDGYDNSTNTLQYEEMLKRSNCYINKFINSFLAYANACGLSFVQKDIDDILALN